MKLSLLCSGIVLALASVSFNPVAAETAMTNPIAGSCEDTGTNCGVTRPEAGQGSLNEVLTGVVE